MTLQTSDPDTKMEQHDTIGVAEVNNKVCADCAHLIGVRHRVESAADKWRCGAEQNLQGLRTDFVTGLKHKVFVIEDIYRARLELCNGNLWELYIAPVYKAPDMTEDVKTQLTEIVFTKEQMDAGRIAAQKRLDEMKKAKAAKSGLANVDPKEL